MNLVIDWLAGNCPVQAEGNVDGKPFYFRARGNRWSMEIFNDVGNDTVFFYEEAYGTTEFEAGWMSDAEAKAFISKAANLFAKETNDN